ncbi:MAG: class I SAM-dependent methyltransferase [Deltaproteobacteria bacterium]|nr:class I SAM-dependent methyltransferase [Deltaproteobacteria bacterium]
MARPVPGCHVDALFGHIVTMHGTRPWGRVLDAGTGRASLQFVMGLQTESWTAVTGDDGEERYLARELGAPARPGDRVLTGHWRDATLLQGQVFDVVLADYLLGAVDRVDPYFQEQLLERLRQHVSGRLYLVGLEPLPDRADGEGPAALRELMRLADVTRLLAGERLYREFPLEWVQRSLVRAGFHVVNATVFPIVYRTAAVDRQLAGCRDRLAHVDAPTRAALEARAVRLAATARDAARAGGIRMGSDYVVTAEPTA